MVQFQNRAVLNITASADLKAIQISITGDEKNTASIPMPMESVEILLKSILDCFVSVPHTKPLQLTPLESVRFFPHWEFDCVLDDEHRSYLIRTKNPGISWLGLVLDREKAVLLAKQILADQEPVPTRTDDVRH